MEHQKSDQAPDNDSDALLEVPNGDTPPHQAEMPPSDEAPGDQAPVPTAGLLSVETLDEVDPESIKLEFTASEGFPIELPDGTRIESILVSGDDLFIRDGDGLLIAIRGGLQHAPTIILDEVEIPSEALAFSLDAAGITLPAAGPDPQPEPPPSSGGDFAADPGTVGDPFDLTGLLPPTAFNVAFPQQEDFTGLLANSVPAVTVGGVGSAVELDETDAGPSSFPISQTTTTPILTSTPDFGSDGPAAVDPIAYSLSLSGETASGLQTTEGNFPITLVQISDTEIQGRYDGGDMAFSIVINADGTLTVTQIVALHHSDPTDPNDTIDLSGLITAKVTITDSNGDTASASAEIGGGITFFDDAPVAADDDAFQAGENAPVVFDAFANDVFGADGVDIDNAPDVKVTFTQGSVADSSVTYNATTGLFTYTPAAGQDGGSDSFTYTLEDGDGDTSTATVTVNFAGDSDPTVSVTDGVVDEKGLSQGTNPGDGSETTTGTFTIGTGNDPLGALEVQDEAGAWIDVTAGGTVQGDNGVLTVTDDGSGNYSWSYTLTDNLLTHDDNDDNVSDGDSDRGAADQQPGEAFAVRVIDDEDDISAEDTLDITVNDDGPVVSVGVDDQADLAGLSLTLDESVGHDPGGDGETYDVDPPGANDILSQATTSISGGLASLFDLTTDAGADGEASRSEVLRFVGVPALGLATTLSATDGGAITLYLVDDVLVGRDATNDSVFEIAIIEVSEGEFQLQTTLYETIEHSETASFDESEVLKLLEEGAVQLEYKVTLVDNDGDETVDSEAIDVITEETSSFAFQDDGPSVALSDAATVSVDEDDLDNFDEGDSDGDDIEGSKGTDGIQPTVQSFTLGGVTPLVSFGADGQGSFGFVNQAVAAAFVMALGAVGYSSKGSALNDAQISGNVLTAYAADGRAIFTLELTEATDGTYDFSLLDQLDHDVLAVSDGMTLPLDLSGLIQIADGDGDTAVLQAGSVQIEIVDDVPNDISPTPAMVINSGDAVGSSPLDYFQNIGADESGSVVFAGINGGAAESDGAQLFQTDGTTAVTTKSGDNIYLYGFGTGILVASTESGFSLIGYDPSNPPSHVVFHVFLNPDNSVEANDLYTIEFFQQLEDGSGQAFDTGSTVTAGNSDWIELDGSVPTGSTPDPDLLITAYAASGASASSVNTTGADIGVGNQWIDDNDVLRIDMVDNVQQGANLGGNKFTYDYASHFADSSFSFLVAQTGSSGTGATLILRIANHDDDGPADVSPTGGENAYLDLSADEIVISDINGDPIDPLDLAAAGIVITQVSGGDLADGVEITGLLEGMRVEINNTVENTSSGTPQTFEAVEIEGSGGQFFSINAFVVGQNQGGEPVDMSFDLDVTDEDGDTSTGQIDVTVVPDNGMIEGTAAGEALIGGAEADILLGGDGDDILAGGLGIDNVTGGLGADTFVLTDLTTADVFYDYDMAEGDIIDLAELLDVYPLDQGNVEATVRYNESGSGVLEVNAGSGFEHVATLQNAPLNIMVAVDDGAGAQQNFEI